jgi:hypothetical protein
LAILTVFAVVPANGQSRQKTAQKIDAGIQSVTPAKSSPAYAELLLRGTGLESELEAFLIDYTEEYPKVKEIRFELSRLNAEKERLLAVKPAEAGKLTLALGKLMVEKASLETALWKLLQVYKDEHPEVKRARKRVEIYEKAIKEIMG